jgi:hypothetical protein
MGNQGSSQCLEAHYAHLLGKHMQFGATGEEKKIEAKVGGAVVGGYSALEDYGNSVYSKAKEELIRGIAADVSVSLQVKGDYAKTAPIKDLIAKFKRIVPDPRNGKNLTANSNVHKQICSKLAESINKRYDMNIIETNAEPGTICQKVSEIMYSLFTGLHTEFLSVAGDVSRIIKNLQILKEYVDAASNKIFADLAKSGDDSVSAEAENIKALYTRLSDEINRQHAILANLTDSVIGPLGKSLITVLADNEDFVGLSDDLKNMVGSVQFGQKLSYLLTGTGDITHAAHLVDKALKEIGMSVKEYKNVSNLQDLRDKVYQNMLRKKPSTNELHKLLVAADILYRNDLAHDDIASYLEKKKGGSIAGGDFADMVDDLTYSDPTNTPFVGRTQAYRKSIGKQVQNQNKYRRELLSTLNGQIKSKYNIVTASLHELAKKIGNEISLTPELDLFIRNLNAFKKFQPDRQNMHIALSGIWKDISSDYVKSRYMEYLYILSDCLNDVIKSSSANLFKVVKQEIDSLIRLIDEFNLNFTKTLTDVHVDFTPRKRGGDLDYDENMDYNGGKKKKHRKNNLQHESDEEKSEPEQLEYSDVVEPVEVEMNEGEMVEEEKVEEESIVGGNDVLAEIAGGLQTSDFQHYVTMGKVINEIDYYYRIAGVKSGMQLAATSYDVNVVNYENILGEEAGWIIDRIQKRYNDLMAGLTENPPAGWSAEKTYVTDVFGGINAAAQLITAMAAAAAVAGNAGNARNAARAILADNKWAGANPNPYPNLNFEVLFQASRAAGVVAAVRGINGFAAVTVPNNAPGNAGAVAANILHMLPFIQIDRVPGAFNETLRENMTDVGGEFKEYEGGYKFLLEYVRSSKIEMIEAAQALDLYLSKFTKQIQLHPDQIKDFAKIVEQLEIVAKWFTNKSGDNFVNVFESFPNNVAGGNFAEIANYPDLDMADRAAVLADGDGNSRFHLTGEVGTRGNHLNGEYYSELVPATAGDHTQYSPGKFYRARMMTRQQAINFVKEIEKSIKSVRALENIISTFSKVNVEVSDNVRTFMSSGSMFKAFMKYCVGSVISIGVAPINIADQKLCMTRPQVATNALFSKMAVGLKFNDKIVPWTHGTGIAMIDPLSITRIGERSLVDRIFEMCIKSMASKIFVVVGNYSLFNKPAKLERSQSSMANNALRQIMGGNAEGGSASTKIIPEAIELYIRLPLLVEWYRTVFDFAETAAANAHAQNNNVGIFTLVPDMEGIFGRLCKAIFIDGNGIDNGAYPSAIYVKIIDAINDIYNGYKSKNKNVSCQEILKNFVAEINNKYGLMKRDEIKEYLKKRNEYLQDNKSNYEEEDNRVDYDILDAENSLGRNPAPSDRFRSLHNNPALNRQGMQLFDKAVRDFRHAIESNLLLENANDEKNLHVHGNVSLSEMVRNIRKRVEEANDDKERYNIIHSQMHGIEKYGGLDKQKLMLFHETVITPLTTLYFVYLIVNDFNKFMVSLNTKALDEIVNVADDYKYFKWAQCNDVDGVANQAGFQQAVAHPVEFTKSIAATMLKHNNDRFKTDKYKLTDVKAVANIDSIHDYKFVARYVIDNEYAHYLFNDDTKTVVDVVPDAVNNYAGMPNWYVAPRGVAPAALGAPANSGPTGLRMAFNKNRLMEDLLRKVMNVGCDLNGLAEIYFSGSGKERYFNVNFDNLEKLCTELYTEAKGALRLFKKYLPSRIINEYEDIQLKSQVHADQGNNVVSLFFIKEHLFERLFNNKYGNGLSDANAALGNIYNYLTREYNINPAHEAPAAAADLKQWKFDSYNDVFSKLTFWNVANTVRPNYMNKFGLREITSNAQKANSFPAKYVRLFSSNSNIAQPKTESDKKYAAGLLGNDNKILSESIRAFDRNVVNVLQIAGNDNKDLPYQAILGAHNLYDYNVGLSNESKLQLDPTLGHNIMGDRPLINDQEELGLLVKLNQLVYSYVQAFIDKTNGKIYKPLLEKFINGHNSKDILQGKNINDKVLVNAQGKLNFRNNLITNALNTLRSGALLYEPQQNAALFGSVANGLEGLFNTIVEKLTSNVPLFLEDNFASVNEYQKELYRAYLPVFEKELNLILSRSDFLKKVIENTPLKVYKHYSGGAGVGNNNKCFKFTGVDDGDVDIDVDLTLMEFYPLGQPLPYTFPQNAYDMSAIDASVGGAHKHYTALRFGNGAILRPDLPAFTADEYKTPANGWVQRARNGAILLSNNRNLGRVVNGVTVEQRHLDALEYYAMRECATIMAEVQSNNPQTALNTTIANCYVGATNMYNNIIRSAVNHHNDGNEYKNEFKDENFIIYSRKVIDMPWRNDGVAPLNAFVAAGGAGANLRGMRPLLVLALQKFVRKYVYEIIERGNADNVGDVGAESKNSNNAGVAAVYQHEYAGLGDPAGVAIAGAVNDEFKMRGLVNIVPNVFPNATASKIVGARIFANANANLRGCDDANYTDARSVNSEIFHEAVKIYLNLLAFGNIINTDEPLPITFQQILTGAQGWGIGANNALTATYTDNAGMHGITDIFNLEVKNVCENFGGGGIGPGLDAILADDVKRNLLSRYISYTDDKNTLIQSYNAIYMETQNGLANGDEKISFQVRKEILQDFLRVSYRQMIQIFGNEFNQFNPKLTQRNKIPQIELEASRKTYLLGMLNDITNTASSLNRCVTSVQKELSDIPLFMEQYQGSLTDYNTRNGHLPLIPLSSLTNLMNVNLFRQNIVSKDYDGNEANFDAVAEADVEYATQLVPREDNSGVGSTSFKWLYATRGVLNPNQKVAPEHMPGIMDIVDKFNSVSGGATTFDKSSMSAIVKSSVPLMRYVLDYMYLQQVLDKQDYSSVRRLMIQQQAQLAALNANNRVRNLTCQTGKNKNFDPNTFWRRTENVLQLSENNNYSESINRLLSCITQDNKTGNNLPQDRKVMRVYNILDSNIVPINVHAMQKEVPFINLMNYSYTFDHLCKELIGQVYRVTPLYDIKGDSPTFPAADRQGFSDGNEWKNFMHPEDTLVRSMIYPMGYRPLGEYINNVYRLMAGNTSLSLGRPKFLSDQLWNKVLCNNLFDNKLNDGVNDAKTQADAKDRDLNAARMISTLRNITRQRAFHFNVGAANVEPYTNVANAGINIADKGSNGPAIELNILRSLGHINPDGTYQEDLAYVAGVDPGLNNIGYMGYLRYNSALIRWTEWFANIQRLLRMLMRHQLEWVQDPVVTGHDALSEDLTEYSNNNTFNLADFE